MWIYISVIKSENTEILLLDNKRHIMYSFGYIKIKCHVILKLIDKIQKFHNYSMVDRMSFASFCGQNIFILENDKCD